ncbi:MAG: hypothetical protein IJ333_10095 [Clostridia bacterium]|nr:hypothetical protein [Clostridia bacterium]
MKFKKFTLPTRIFAVYFLICILLSFDWPFLRITSWFYLGFWLTFFLLFIQTFPLVTGAVAIGGTIHKRRKKQKAKMDIVCSWIGVVMILSFLLLYLKIISDIWVLGVLSLMGIGTLIIWIYWLFEFMKKRRNAKAIRDQF